MNEQEELLVRQSRWSGRRIVLFYWFAIVFLGTSAAAGLGTTILLPNYKVEADSNHDGITEPWGPTDCEGADCHNDTVDDWNATWHSQMVGEYDPNDITLNGSRMSYNSTHYWRTPKMPFGVTVNYWTYNQIFNASGQQCCMTTRWTNTTLINATTEEVLWTNATLVAQYGGNIWDIGVSCAACHSSPGVYSLSFTTCSSCHLPGGRQHVGLMGSAHYGALDDLLASGDINSINADDLWDYVGQSTFMSPGDLDIDDYYTITCVTCHDPHDSSINEDDVSNAMSPWKNPYTGEYFGPGGSQLRAATVNALCGSCHDISLNTTAKGYLDPSNHTDLSCTDCHGYSYTAATYFENGTLDEASSVSSLNHNWKFNFGETGCGVCHDENATTVYNSMLDYQTNFGNLTDMKATYETKLTAATAAYETAKATEGVDIDLLANAYALIEEAKELAQGTSVTFHNPELGAAVEAEQLSLALTKLDDALDDATDALPEETTTEDVTTTTEPVVVTTTTTEEPEPEPTPAIGLLAIMGILGVVALFRRKRR